MLNQGFQQDDSNAFEYDKYKPQSPQKQNQQFGLTNSAIQARNQYQSQQQQNSYQPQAQFLQQRSQQQQGAAKQSYGSGSNYQQNDPWASASSSQNNNVLQRQYGSVGQMAPVKNSFYQQKADETRRKQNELVRKQNQGQSDAFNKRVMNLIGNNSENSGPALNPSQPTRQRNSEEQLLSQYRSYKQQQPQSLSHKQIAPEEISDDDDSPIDKLSKFKKEPKVSPSPTTDSVYNRLFDEQIQFKPFPQRPIQDNSKPQSLLSKPHQQQQSPETSKPKPLSRQDQEKNSSKIKEKINKTLNLTAAGTSKNITNPYSIKHAKKHITLGRTEEEDKQEGLKKISQMITTRLNSAAKLQQPSLNNLGEKVGEEDAKSAEKKKKDEEEKRKASQSFLSQVLGFQQPNVQPQGQTTQKQENSNIDESMKEWIQQVSHTPAVLSTEEQRQKQEDSIRNHLQEEARRQREEQLKRIRFNNRKTVDELIKPILNLSLIEMFKGEDRAMFDSIPSSFDSFEQYRETWIPLFLYETYNQLINQRTDGERDRELLQAQGIKTKDVSLKMHFEGLIQRHTDNREYIEVKLYECARSEPDKFGNFHMNILDQIKDFDLLLLSPEPLPTNEVKKLTNADYLLQIKKEKGKMLTVVTARRKKDQNYIILKLDRELHNDFMMVKVVNLDFLKMHVYYFDSLITTVREFRTIKSCEFFPTAQIILQPSIINELGDGEDTEPEKKRIMETFINSQRNHFNTVQLQALEHVAKMKREDFLLIQGPPGTGKTHTIQGIITMLVQSNVKRILICAPSNAAIDEIVMRIATFKLFGTLSEAQLKTKLLRLGSMDYDPLPNVRNYTLDYKIKEIMDDETNPKQGNSVQQQLDNKIYYLTEKTQYISTMRRIIKNDLEEKEKSRLSEISSAFFGKGQEGFDKLRKFYRQGKEAKLKELDAADEVYKKKKEELEKEARQYERGRDKPKLKRNEVEKQIIQEAQIICTTLSMSASEKLELIDSIEYLIVDEACQCVELTNLIPFEHDPKKVILVGDHQQLPATTFSENSDITCYSRSLFERFLENEVKRFMLSIQYRMNPIIRQFPSDQFYEGGLQDAQAICQGSKTPSFLVDTLQKSMSNLVFFDLKYAQEQASETSKTNMDEVAFIEALFTDLIKVLLNASTHLASHSDRLEYLAKELKSKFGIISPYKQQVHALKRSLFAKLRTLNLPCDVLEINTVDAYQGREKEIVIISCVRGSQGRTLGFLNDYRRMNVAITRAKSFLWVVGNSRTLSRNEHWGAFIQYAKQLNSQQNSDSTEVIKRGYIQLHDKKDWAQEHKLMNIITNQGKKKAPSPREEGEMSPQESVMPPRNQQPRENPYKRDCNEKRDQSDKRDNFDKRDRNNERREGQRGKPDVIDKRDRGDLRQVIEKATTEKKRDQKREEKKKEQNPLSCLLGMPVQQTQQKPAQDPKIPPKIPQSSHKLLQTNQNPIQNNPQNPNNRGGSSSSTDAQSINSPNKVLEVVKKPNEEKTETDLLFDLAFSKF